MTDLATLATDLLANFRTIRIPPSERLEEPPEDWWTTAKARRAEHRAAYAYCDRLRSLLVEHGHHRFLHHLEPDPAGGWRLHFFFVDDTALPILDEITKGVCGQGDAVSFDAEKFVLQHVRYLIKSETLS